MKKISKYNTKQRQNILNYLKENVQKHITAEEIIEHFKKQKNPISKSTIYRYLDNLVLENVIRKYISQERACACFQYIENQESCITHYHMKCVKCGALFHLDCEEVLKLELHLIQNHNFKLDICKTVLYGTCQKCLN